MVQLNLKTFVRRPVLHQLSINYIRPFRWYRNPQETTCSAFAWKKCWTPVVKRTKHDYTIRSVLGAELPWAVHWSWLPATSVLTLCSLQEYPSKLKNIAELLQVLGGLSFTWQNCLRHWFLLSFCQPLWTMWLSCSLPLQRPVVFWIAGQWCPLQKEESRICQEVNLQTRQYIDKVDLRQVVGHNA